MAEGFARALEEISSELSNVKDLQGLYSTEEMELAIIQLYDHVMRFLCASMRWCMKEGSIGKFQEMIFFLFATTLLVWC
jgi:hypothetical protein